MVGRPSGSGFSENANEVAPFAAQRSKRWPQVPTLRESGFDTSFRFGPLSEPRQRYLFEGSVAGIGGYGNCLGVPTIGGEVYFDEAYSGNCLINAMSLGLMREEDLTLAVAAGPGNVLVTTGGAAGLRWPALRAFRALSHPT